MEFRHEIKKWMDAAVVNIGNTQITLWTVTYLLLLTFLLVIITSKLKKLVIHRLLSKSGIDIGVLEAFGSIFRYVILTIGFIIILQTAGIDLSSLTILFGALGVGIGFGLQNITNNFVSGLIILFERPIKIGDRIEVGGITGDVTKISMRATTILTNDNISIIVPNSEFISSSVINWSHNDRKVRFQIPVAVSYKEDPEKVRDIIVDVASKNNAVLKDPPPFVRFSEYGDSALIFSLRAWTTEYINRPGAFRSILFFDIFKRFREEGIEIPYPQRDIHIKDIPGSSEIKVS